MRNALDFPFEKSCVAKLLSPKQILSDGCVKEKMSGNKTEFQIFKTILYKKFIHIIQKKGILMNSFHFSFKKPYATKLLSPKQILGDRWV